MRYILVGRNDFLVIHISSFEETASKCVVEAMMKLLFPLSLVPLCLSFDIPRQGCDHQVKIGEHRYNLTHTVDLGNASAVDAHYDVYGNLFYVNSTRTNGENFFNIYMIERNTQVPIKVGGLPDGRSYSVAVDKTYADVYFGTNKGIFRFNYETFQAVLDSDGDMKVDMLYIDNDGNKYITEGNNGVEEVYFLDGVKKVRYNALEALNEMAIDDKNNFYYIRDESFYILKSDSLKPDLIGNVTYYGVAQIAFYKDYVFIASERLVYYNENMNTELKHIENIPDNAKAVAFDDNGNFMLGTDGKLMKYDKSDCLIRKE